MTPEQLGRGKEIVYAIEDIENLLRALAMTDYMTIQAYEKMAGHYELPTETLKKLHADCVAELNARLETLREEFKAL